MDLVILSKMRSEEKKEDDEVESKEEGSEP
jgi:hypothetical protein